MAEIVLVRNEAEALTEEEKAIARRVVFGFIDGLGDHGKKQWRRLWNRLMKLEAGEIVAIQAMQPRSGPFHRRHMLIEQRIFDAQERFDQFDQFRYWTKVGAGWVTWAAGPSGGVVPIPRSTSYAAADQAEFAEFHEAVMKFYRGPHAARYLWPASPNAHERMDIILQDFGEA